MVCGGADMTGSRALALMLAALLSTAFQAAPARAADVHWPSDQTPVNADGWGAIRIGMTVGDFERTTGVQIDLDTGASGSEACAYAILPKPLGESPQFMFESRILTSIRVFQGDVASDRGIRIGDSARQVRAAYPRGLEAGPNAYDSDPPTQNLTVWNVHTRRGVRYAIDENGRVSDILVGGKSITYDEGCA